MTAVAWRSVREHGGEAGPLAIGLNSAAVGLAAVCEPRRDGVQRIEVDFDVDVSGLLAGQEPEVPIPDFADAYQTQRVLEAALISAQNRAAVKMSDVK